jgi:hypothetical protein
MMVEGILRSNLTSNQIADNLVKQKDEEAKRDAMATALQQEFPDVPVDTINKRVETGAPYVSLKRGFLEEMEATRKIHAEGILRDPNTSPADRDQAERVLGIYGKTPEYKAKMLALNQLYRSINTEPPEIKDLTAEINRRDAQLQKDRSWYGTTAANDTAYAKGVVKEIEQLKEQRARLRKDRADEFSPVKDVMAMLAVMFNGEPPPPPAGDGERPGPSDDENAIPGMMGQASRDAASAFNEAQDAVSGGVTRAWEKIQDFFRGPVPDGSDAATDDTEAPTTMETPPPDTGTQTTPAAAQKVGPAGGDVTTSGTTGTIPPAMRSADRKKAEAEKRQAEEDKDLGMPPVDAPEADYASTILGTLRPETAQEVSDALVKIAYKEDAPPEEAAAARKVLVEVQKKVVRMGDIDVIKRIIEADDRVQDIVLEVLEERNDDDAKNILKQLAESGHIESFERPIGRYPWAVVGGPAPAEPKRGWRAKRPKEPKGELEERWRDRGTALENPQSAFNQRKE